MLYLLFLEGQFTQITINLLQEIVASCHVDIFVFIWFFLDILPVLHVSFVTLKNYILKAKQNTCPRLCSHTDTWTEAKSKAKTMKLTIGFILLVSTTKGRHYDQFIEHLLNKQNTNLKK